jgi:uncharacterized membrane protein
MLQLFTRQYSLFSLKGVTALAFRKNGFKFTSTGLDKVIKNNVFYPDMKCLLQLLADYLVPASLVKLTVEQLSDLSGYAAILYMRVTPVTTNNAHYYVFLEKVVENKIIYYTSGKQKIEEDLETFKTKWDGITLLFIKSRCIKERNYSVNLLQQLLRYLCFIGLALAAFFMFRTVLFNASNAFLLLSMLAIAGAGIFFSCRIYLLQHAHTFGKTGNSKCNLYKGFECDKVFSSGFGKLLGILPLSEMALYYYAILSVLICYHVLVPYQPTGILLILLITPVVIVPYSIFVQAVLIKSWCINCLMVMGTIILNAFLAVLLFNEQGLDAAALECWMVLGTGAALFLSSVFIKRMVYRYRAFPEKEKALENIKRYQPLFIVMQDTAAVITNECPPDFQVNIGNPEKNTLVIALSPFCPACKALFLQVKESCVLDDVNCRITFVLCNTGTAESREAGVLIAVAMKQEGTQNIMDVLDLWYKESDCSRFKKRMAANPVSSEIEKAEGLLDRHSVFSSQQKIDQLPALFLNNRQVNSFYDYTGLKYFLA